MFNDHYFGEVGRVLTDLMLTTDRVTISQPPDGFLVAAYKDDRRVRIVSTNLLEALIRTAFATRTEGQMQPYRGKES